LRILVVFASSINAGYTLVDTEYNYLDCQFLWAIVQTLVNLFRLTQTFLQYQQVKKSMTVDDMMVRDQVFSNYSLNEFKCVKDAWYQRTVSPGTKLMSEGESVDDLKLIVSGKAKVSSLDENMYEVQQGNFVGELSFFTGNAASATITAKTQVSMVCWDKVELLKLMQSKGRDHKASAFQKMPHVLLGELSHTATALTSKLAQQTSKMREVEFDTSRWRMIASNLNQIVTNIAAEEAVTRKSNDSTMGSRRGSSNVSANGSTRSASDGPMEGDFSMGDAAATAAGAAAAMADSASPASPMATNLKKCPTRSHQISRRTSSSTRSRGEAFTVARVGWQRSVYGGEEVDEGDDDAARKASMSAVRKLLGGGSANGDRLSVSRLTTSTISSFFAAVGNKGQRNDRGGATTATVTPDMDTRRREHAINISGPNADVNADVNTDVSGDAYNGLGLGSFSKEPVVSGHRHPGNGHMLNGHMQHALDQHDSDSLTNEHLTNEHLDALIDMCSARITHDTHDTHGPTDGRQSPSLDLMLAAHSGDGVGALQSRGGNNRVAPEQIGAVMTRVEHQEGPPGTPSHE
jgi:CRP-like cAMP-binding protein